jgi:hypothetical protein
VIATAISTSMSVNPRGIGYLSPHPRRTLAARNATRYTGRRIGPGRSHAHLPRGRKSGTSVDSAATRTRTSRAPPFLRCRRFRHAGSDPPAQREAQFGEAVDGHDLRQGAIAQIGRTVDLLIQGEQ